MKLIFKSLASLVMLANLAVAAGADEQQQSGNTSHTLVALAYHKDEAAQQAMVPGPSSQSMVLCVREFLDGNAIRAALAGVDRASNYLVVSSRVNKALKEHFEIDSDLARRIGFAFANDLLDTVLSDSAFQNDLQAIRKKK